MDIKQVIKQSGLKQYEIADYLGKKESNFCRDLRYPISKEYENKILLGVFAYFLVCRAVKSVLMIDVDVVSMGISYAVDSLGSGMTAFWNLFG